MIFVSFESSQWDEDGFCNNFQIKNFKRNLKFDDSDLEFGKMIVGCIKVLVIPVIGIQSVCKVF